MGGATFGCGCPRTQENTFRDVDGYERCRICKRARTAESNARRAMRRALASGRPAPPPKTAPAATAVDYPPCRECGKPTDGGWVAGYGDVGLTDSHSNTCRSCREAKDARFRAWKAAGGSVRKAGPGIWRAKAVGSRRTGDDGQVADTA